MTGSNHTRPTQLDQTGPDPLKLDSNQTTLAENGFDWLKADQTVLTGLKPEKTGCNRLKTDQTGSNWIKPDQTG